MRGMINFMQSNQNNLHNYKIIDSKIWELLLGKIQRKVKISRLLDIISKISIDYNMEGKNIIKDLKLLWTWMLQLLLEELKI